MTQYTDQLIQNHRASMPTHAEQQAENITRQGIGADIDPFYLIDDLDLLLQDEEVWTVYPPIRHGLEPITLATAARQIRRRHREKSEREVRIATCVLFFYLNEGTRPYRRAAWNKLQALFL